MGHLGEERGGEERRRRSRGGAGIARGLHPQGEELRLCFESYGKSGEVLVSN